LFAVYCLLLASSSSPRRVGDGVEYWAMAEQMRTGHLPSATRADLARLEREAPAIGAGFDRSPLRFPHLVGADGRQDFPHFWLYPLLNVPALALVSAAGIHPGWAFTLTNIVLLAAAVAIVARSVSIAWALLLLGGPLVWWIDKAHGDVFTVALLAVGCAWWHRAPAWTMIAVALAAAQNPALMPVWAIVCLAACWPVIRARLGRRASPHDVSRDSSAAAGHSPGDVVRDVAVDIDGRIGIGTAQAKPSETPRALVTAVAVSAAVVALPLAYYKIRLGVWSPLIGYTHPTWPSLRAIVSLLADPNVGLLPNAPCVAAAGVWAIAARDSRVPWRDWMLAAAACVLMLAAFSQSVNLNHGATPGLNRWTLWLTPWLLLIVRSRSPEAAAARQRETPRRREASARVLIGLAALNLAWGAWFFRPSLPEVYRYPTMTASWLWTHAPRWYAPAPEIFAERVSHREPATLPVASPGCTKVLIIDGRWPASCVPTAPAPAGCLGADRLCYATPSAAAFAASAASSESTSLTAFTPLGDVSFPWAPAARSWPGNAPFVAALHAELTRGDARSAGRLEPAEEIVRATNGVGWTTAWSDGSRLAIYVQDVIATPNASLSVRVDSDYNGQLIDLDTGKTLASITVARSTGEPSAILLPVSVQHALLELERAR
jgi:hypothetical protein